MTSAATPGSGASLRFRFARAFRKLLRLDRERRWNRQYAEGGWEWLRNLDELAHHAVLAAYFARLKPGGSVLDVGCGEGVFHEQLRGCYSRYLGIDFAAPIERAQTKVDASTRFVVADMNDFDTTERFDAVVFNESFYYHHDPRFAAAQYERFLAPEGVFLVSMASSPRIATLWDMLGERYRVLDEVTMHNAKGTQWITKVLAPPAADTSPVSPRS